jgi:hypothetical protein
MRKTILINLLVMLLTQLVGCSGQSFNTKVETADVDLLKEESLMRFNTNRLEIMAGAENDFKSSG